MKKTILTSVLLSGLILAAAPTALAVENEKGHSVEKSEVHLELKKDDGYEPGTGPFKDKLAIAHKPTAFIYKGNVNKGSISLDNENEKAEQQFIAVNDDRKDPNDKTGKTPMSSKWDLTGKMSELTIGAEKLAAEIRFVPTALYKYDIGELNEDGTDFKPKDMLEQTKDPADAGKYELQKTFTLKADNKTETTFLSSKNADVSDVHGVYTNLGANKMILATGSALNAGKTQGTITWTLAAQP